jgi:predicted butyrate kinase (DUF1464 family)
MPPPRKVDLLPSELKSFLQDALKKRGFGGYEDLADELNSMLEAEGMTLRIGKSALHAYGQEYSEFVKYQEEASSWAAEWMNDNGLEEEAQRHNILFQMITTLAFKVMQTQMSKSGDEIDPKELHFIGKMLKDVMSSSGMREKMKADERTRVAEEAAQAERTRITTALDQSVASGDVDLEAAQKAREIMGFA